MSEEVAVYHTDNQLPMQYQMDNPDSMLALAVEVARFVKEQKLSKRIGEKDYVFVEGWQFAGACLGLQAITGKVISHCTGDEIKYEVGTDIVRLKDNKVVGHGESICSNKETRKVKFEEYAIHSMVQTRSIGKAYRNTISWLIKAAGFEPTPAEEMEFDEKPKLEPKTETKPPLSIVDNTIVYDMVRGIPHDELTRRILELYSEEPLHPMKQENIIRFYRDGSHHKEFVAYQEKFKSIHTVGDALSLMIAIPDEKVHSTLVRYWTLNELKTLVDSIKHPDETTNDTQF